MDRILAFTYPLNIPDNQFSVVGSSDATKTLKFEVDAQSAGADLTINTGAQTADRSATFPVMTGNTIIAVSDTTLTSGRVPFVTTNGVLTDSTSVTWSGTIFQIGGNPGGSDTLKVNGPLTLTNQINMYPGSSSPGEFVNRTSGGFDFYPSGSLQLRISAAGVFSSNNTTDSTSKDTGSIVTEGGIGVERAIVAGTSIKSVSPTAGVGYATGAGGTVTQGTSRTTGVTLDKVCGQITLFSAAGTATWQSFTVTNSAVATTDTIIVNQDSGTDLYVIHVTAVGAGSFRISYATTGGTTTEQPVFNFSVIKAVTS